MPDSFFSLTPYQRDVAETAFAILSFVESKGIKLNQPAARLIVDREVALGFSFKPQHAQDFMSPRIKEMYKLVADISDRLANRIHDGQANELIGMQNSPKVNHRHEISDYLRHVARAINNSVNNDTHNTLTVVPMLMQRACYDTIAP